jgi:uncharacterized protein DUF4416
MGDVRPSEPARLFVGLLSRHRDLLDETIAALVREHGPLERASEPFPFVWTDYYAATMGADLLRVLLSFERDFDTGRLAEVKLSANRMEVEAARTGRFPEPRPLNVDPGYLTQSKLVLASTKDHAHRVHLGRGIHAEVTLAYREGAWQPQPWTYPDFRSDRYAAWLLAARDALRSSRPLSRGKKDVARA